MVATNADSIVGVAGVAAQPAYIIEQYRIVDNENSLSIGSGEVPRVRAFHRITARGVGLTGTTVVQVQSTFVQSYN